MKAIDPIFRKGDLNVFWPALRALVAMAPERADLSRKKSHYLVSLAARSLRRDDPEAAAEFLDYADRKVNRDHLTAYFVEERRKWRGRVDATLRARQNEDRTAASKR